MATPRRRGAPAWVEWRQAVFAWHERFHEWYEINGPTEESEGTPEWFALEAWENSFEPGTDWPGTNLWPGWADTSVGAFPAQPRIPRDPESRWLRP